jgi:hypothetical protein
MPLRDHLNRITGKLEDLIGQHNNAPTGQYQNGPHQQYPGQSQPPPVPMHSRPGGGPQPPVNQPTVYWRASFEPSAPVSQEWDQKTGNNNGWGNAELENYTASPENSFFTGDRKLVLRAISRPQHPDPGQRFTSARLVSRQTLGRSRGCLTTYLSMPCATGIWPAFWMLPREPFTWPHEGEVDIAESWNGDGENHSCLHWGFYTPEDHMKHLVRGTHIPDMASGRPIRFDFAWDCPSGGPGGRLLWSIDGRPVMKNVMPEGTRRIDDWCVIINVAMGGNVCAGKTPPEGSYDFVVHEVKLSDDPEGGWGSFEAAWQVCPQGGPL